MEEYRRVFLGVLIDLVLG